MKCQTQTWLETLKFDSDESNLNSKPFRFDEKIWEESRKNQQHQLSAAESLKRKFWYKQSHNLLCFLPAVDINPPSSAQTADYCLPAIHLGNIDNKT